MNHGDAATAAPQPPRLIAAMSGVAFGAASSFTRYFYGSHNLRGRRGAALKPKQWVVQTTTRVGSEME